MVVYKTDEWQFQHTVLNSLKFWVPWGASNHLSLSKKCLNFTPLINEADAVFSRFETLLEMSESSNLEHLGGILEHMGICVSQTKSLKGPLLRIMVDKIADILSKNPVLVLKITWDISRSRRH